MEKKNKIKIKNNEKRFTISSDRSLHQQDKKRLQTLPSSKIEVQS